ncbi:MAG: aspartate aminotransferase family protein [Gammaproteobacteria bacterium]|nr:aspartate aminotransferase family protein [Gammaproteobacteria bacterium]
MLLTPPKNLTLIPGCENDISRRANIFNQHSLGSFTSAIKKGTALINKKISQAKAPFSGIFPEELSKQFAGLDLDTPQDSLDHALAELESLYLNDAVYFHHPKYMAHLNTPVTNVSILAELIQAAVNTSVDTWDQSAGGTLIEQSLVDWTLSRIGYETSKGDGVFTSGGTQSNLMALLLARDNYCLEQLNGHSVQQLGLPKEAHRFRIFTSQASHFSVQKSASLLGLGFNSVISVPVDQHFRMDIHALKEAINRCKKEGGIPLAVVATMGTTDFGSIDPIASIAPLCEAENMWLHADSAYGCGLLLSNKYRHYLQGLALADSVTVDYHKSFFQPVACSAFFTKNSNHLHCLTYHADYLNPLSEKLAGTPNLVCKSLQTTRRFDALKLWLTLRTVGPKTLGEAFDSVIDLAQSVYLAHHKDTHLEFIHPPQLSTLLFRYKSKNTNGQHHTASQINQINKKIRQLLSRNAEALIASTTVNGDNWLKFTFLNPATKLSDVDEVLANIKAHGACLSKRFEKLSQTESPNTFLSSFNNT